MTQWPESPQIEKPCRICGKMMECTKWREICSPCRKEKEKENKRLRRLKKS